MKCTVEHRRVIERVMEMVGDEHHTMMARPSER